jgi:hypothetical protein
MPIIKPEEYPALKAAGLIELRKLPNGRIEVEIDRGEKEDYSKASILTWLAEDRAAHVAYISILDTIKADIDPL